MRPILPLILLAVAGCAPDNDGAARLDHGAAMPGAELYAVYCARCHGSEARGDGVIAHRLDIPPSDLTQLAARNGGTYPAADVIARVHGYPGQFDVMPEYGPLFSEANVIWRDPATGAAIETPRAMVELSAYLSTIQAPAPG